jgi:hypothetical protein
MIATILVHWWYQQNSENAKNVVVVWGACGLWLVDQSYCTMLVVGVCDDTNQKFVRIEGTWRLCLPSSCPPSPHAASKRHRMSGATSTHPSVLPRFASIASSQTPFVGTRSCTHTVSLLCRCRYTFTALPLDQLASGHLLLQPP